MGELRAGVLLHRRYHLAMVGSIPVLWYLVSLSGSENPTGQWMWMEVVFIPGAALLSSDSLVGMYERRELEPWLARRTARILYLQWVIPLAVSAIAATFLLGLNMAVGGPLEGAARCVLQFGFMHFLLNLTRSRWVGAGLFSLWWLLGLFYMQDWAAAPPVVSMWHPMRLSGEGPLHPGLEWQVLAIGVLWFVASWALVGRDTRWIP